MAGTDMTGEPQYLITRDILEQLHYRKKKNPYGGGHGSKYLHLAYWEIDDLVKEVRSHPYNEQAVREKVLDELKADLKTRFVSSNSQWARGRNSGLLECCNIIDELLRQGKVEK